MNREEAYALVKQHMQTKNLIKHVLAVEAIMRGLAQKLNKNEEEWGLAGLLHDLDYDQTKDDPENHSLITAQILTEAGVDAAVVHAIKCHNCKAGKESDLDRALYAADPLSGFIVAAALMHPEKKLVPLDVDFIKRRFAEKRFAAGANREQMASCTEFGLSLDEFMEIGLKSMQAIHKDLGL
jgi:putative nucleotidyltransferase with HDIG domain